MRGLLKKWGLFDSTEDTDLRLMDQVILFMRPSDSLNFFCHARYGFEMTKPLGCGPSGSGLTCSHQLSITAVVAGRRESDRSTHQIRLPKNEIQVSIIQRWQE
jgi:hypothetical protein